jgi:hypothetical protein
MGANNRFVKDPAVTKIFRGLNDTFKSAESYTQIFILDPEVSLRPRNPNFANDYLEYLGEFEAIYDKL